MTSVPETTEAADKGQVDNRKRRWPFWIAGLLLALIGWNATVTIPVWSALSDEDTHSLVAYRRWGISPSQIVIDVRSVSPSGSMADMDRMLFKAAEALKDRNYDGVVLAYHGIGKFILDGAQFQTVGEERAYQNPIYTIRTLTEHITDMDGRPTFGAWTGGWLGVMGKQMEDHNEFHRQWWVQPELGL